MGELIKSLEKSVLFLKQRYPEDLPLLVSLEAQLTHLRKREKEQPPQNPPQSS